MESLEVAVEIMSNKKILITGGTGFIGASIATELQKRGYNISLIARTEKNVPKNILFYKADVIKENEVKEAIRLSQPDIIIHTAGRMNGSWDELYETNVIGTENILNNFSGRIIFLSSSSVYENNPVPFHEEMVVLPGSAYGKTKRMAEELCLERKQAVAVRASVIYGPGQEGTMFIPRLCQYVQQKQGAFPMTPGDQTRDFVYISDVVNAMVKILETEYDGILNIGAGKSYMLNEVLTLAQEIIGEFPIERTLPYRENEVMVHAMDISKARSILEWEPEVELRAGLKRVLNHSAT